MEQPLTLRWQSSRRYFTALLTPDLFGGWMLVTSSSPRAERGGRVNQKPMASYEQGLEAIRRLRHRRRQEGYDLCDGGFAEIGGLDPHARDLRAAETNALLRLFEAWALSPAQQAALLNIDTRSLGQYLDGRPLANDPALLVRVRHLLAIHKVLRLRYGHDPKVIHAWLRLPCARLEGRCPLDAMLASAEGLRGLRQHLEREADAGRGCPGRADAGGDPHPVRPPAAAHGRPQRPAAQSPSSSNCPAMAQFSSGNSSKAM